MLTKVVIFEKEKGGRKWEGLIEDIIEFCGENKANCIWKADLSLLV